MDAAAAVAAHKALIAALDDFGLELEPPRQRAGKNRLVFGINSIYNMRLGKAYRMVCFTGGPDGRFVRERSPPGAD